jgi:carboxypeptidase Taq
MKFMSNQQKAYDQLIERSKEVGLLGSCAGVLSWDKEVNLPKGGANHRAAQMGLLSGLVHEKMTAPEVGRWLQECGEHGPGDDPDSDAAANVRELRRHYKKKTKLPRRLVEELTRTATLAHGAWVEARQESDFSVFQPSLEKILELKREQAECYGYEESIYDALLDDFEPGEKTSRIKEVFAGLRNDLSALVKELQAAPRQPRPEVLEGRYPVERQKMFGEMAASAFGFDFTAGRLDTVVHPFCIGIGPGDTRITTRFNPENFTESFFGILHECGHGLYEQGLAGEHFGVPMGESVSLGIHESQSRMWENFVGRSRAFWKHFFPKAQGIFHESLAGKDFDEFLHAVNRVAPSFIRVEADEATYNLHIILRFEIEQAMLLGDLSPADVPGAWNEKVEDLFGLEVPDDSRGCLQDVHWSHGAIGYFPTYCLGNLYAAQFFAKASQDIPGLMDGFEQGNFQPLLGWLRENIHQHGMKYRPRQLVERVTGRPLGSEALLGHLRDKFKPLYGLV